MAVLVRIFLVFFIFLFTGCASTIDFIEGAPCETTENCVYEYCDSSDGCIDYICAKYNHADTFYYCQKKSDIDTSDQNLIAPEPTIENESL